MDNTLNELNFMNMIILSRCLNVLSDTIKTLKQNDHKLLRCNNVYTAINIFYEEFH